MKRVAEFHTTDPVKLARELPDLEDNVERAINELKRDTVPQAIVEAFQPIGAITVTPLLPDHQLSIDTSLGNAIAVLPAVDPANFGRRFVLIKRVVANQISVTCTDPQATHNAAAFPVVVGAIAGARLFYCDSRGYYS